MVSDSSWKRLQEEATCSICWKYYVNPCILECGHSFCLDCVSHCWKDFPDHTACPQCRIVVERKNCCLNIPLANVVEITKQLSWQVKKKGGEKICEKHPEPSKTVFCVQDQILFCQECERSKQHRNHHVASVEEAAQLYKNWYSSYIEALKKERAEIMKHKFCLVEWIEQLQKKSVSEHQTIVAGFKQLYDLLRKQEADLLTRLESVPKEAAKKRDRSRDMTHLYLDIFNLESNIRLLEEKASQPALEFLRDAMKIFNRCQKNSRLMTLEDNSLGEKWGVWELMELSAMMEGLANYFKGTLQKAFSVMRANVTLDRDSNHPQLLLSSDGKSVKWRRTALLLPDSLRRFGKLYCVVGCQEFTVGRHYWDIIVKGHGEWAVGVAKSSVKRKGFFNLCVEEGVFAVGKMKRQHRIIDMPYSPILLLDGELRWIQVSLNCSAGHVNFYDVARAMRIFAFHEIGSFQESFLPFFWLNGPVELIIIN